MVSAKDVLDVVKGLTANLRAVAVVFLLLGLILVLAGFFELEGRAIRSRAETAYAPFSVGCISLLVAISLILLSPGRAAPSPTRGAKTLVFYAPTFQANSFFAELLHYMWEVAREEKWAFVIERGESGVAFHRAGNYLDVIRRNAGKDRVLIMIPPSPSCYERIWRYLPADLPVNLITLDMGIPAQVRNLFDLCPFHRRVILVDNRLGAELAAGEVAKHCKKEAVKAVNVVVCEGEFHDRGDLFATALRAMAREQGLDVRFLGENTKLSFSDAVKEARAYSESVLHLSARELRERETFWFCANDNLAIGARMAISSAELEGTREIRIVCFDASVFIKMHIDLGDRYFWRAVDQGYEEIVQHAMAAAEALFNGREVRHEVVSVKPKIHWR